MFVSSASLLAPFFVSRQGGLSFIRLLLVLASSYLLLATGQARALEGDTLRPFISANVGIDSNLFRFSSDAQAQASTIGEPIQSVSYQRYGAGIDVDWKQGRQQVTARLAADRTLFSRYSNLLDYTGQDLNGEWKWQLGNRWSGIASASTTRTQSPYTDVSGIVANNVVTDDKLAFQADYWLHADWRARVRLDENKRKYSDTNRQPSDSKYSIVTVGLYRQGGMVERVGVELTDSSGEYPNRVLSPTLDNRSEEQSVRLVASWTLSGKSNLSGSIGQAKRTHPNVSNHDFSGMEWRLAGRWLPTGKTQVEAALSRDLRASDTATVNNEVADAINLSAVWQVLPKTGISGQVGYQRIDYEGSTRKDDLQTATLSVSHEAWRGGNITVGVQHSRRDSTIALQEFSANTLFVAANLKF